MLKHYLLRTGLTAALILGSLASSVSSYAAPAATSTGGSSSRSGPSGSSGVGGGGGGDGGSGAGMPGAVPLALVRPCLAALACNDPPRRVPTVRVRAKPAGLDHCSYYWRKVELDDGSIVEDHTQPMLKNCRVIRTFD
ncbi:hypothetical protein GCM10007874_55880 [Labrys miyagiensis]|uniref:Uncharacterized protein n=1 Tax=Labrys miyagiensis TaxID=346912 RepID=A0ABQ6CU98_9HYPH|nr:hypothetical protein [Labrys miyagiensis]GLS22570.1 hypothetical protein GCM10007874_55880 [Labrys miyagiensis]